MPDPTTPNLWELADLCTPWCVHVVATLRVADHLDAGITRIDDLAAACGAHADSLHRVLRHLVQKEIFAEPSPGVFALNDLARGLIGESGRIGFDLDGIGGRMAHAWGSLLTAVRTGAPAYHEVFGRPFWDDLEANPSVAASFDALMGHVGHGTPDPEILVNNDWDDVHTVVDVGGGTGATIAEILRARPHVRGILVDLPGPISRSRDVLLAAGVAIGDRGTADRITTVAQSFFDPLPPGGDVYLVKNVLADWPDREARALLSRCADAARSRNGRVVVLGGVAPDGPGGGPHPALLMMVLVGGRERTLTEFRELARAAGLTVSATGRQPTGRFVVECRTI